MNLSPNTQAILLLTAPLGTSRESRSEAPLTIGEYNQLAAHLRETQRQPSDLLQADATVSDRIKRLLERTFQLGQAIERWQNRALWIVSRADAAYPRRLKARLKDTAPPILYGCGEPSVLESGGLAVVGSRDADDDLLRYTTAVGQLAARAQQSIVSGGARGVDQAAMRGALDAGGRSVGVLADSLEKTSLQRDYRVALQGGRLALISPYDPGAGFHVGNAMQRNKLVYALSDAALVIRAELERGGTWAGAVEQLDKLRMVTVYVRASPTPNRALDELRKRGAQPWPEPSDADGFRAAIEARPVVAPAQATLALSAPPDPAEELFGKVREVLLRVLSTPQTEDMVSATLGVTDVQAAVWLARLVSEGALERREQPSGYVAKAKRSA